MRFGVVAAAGPVRAAVGRSNCKPGYRTADLAQRWRIEHRSKLEWLDCLERLGMQIGREVDQVFRAHPLARVGLRFGWEGLCWRVPFTWHIALRHRALRDWPH